ncbi:hypothetical protein CUMW_131990 [Citrus unshiu]|uniref:Uncharacterized protein n=1 Tax=Citrus unshiu TaxID=55188 RepID=A0A2H5PFM3_CITUN|nr:hypothetical protein CUMW_131990 [Citrus unshiu]
MNTTSLLLTLHAPLLLPPRCSIVPPPHVAMPPKPMRSAPLRRQYFSRFSHASPCLIICVLVLFGAVSLTFHYSHNLVCISPYDRLSRFGPRLYRPDALESKNGKRVEWTTKDLIEVLEEFVPIYETRPVKNNIYDWEPVMKRHGITNLSRVLIFFYDHQNELKRLKQALKVGFRHLVFEDNYDTGTGDHYSLRQLCDQSFIRGIHFDTAMLISFQLPTRLFLWDSLPRNAMGKVNKKELKNQLAAQQ